MAKDPEAPLQDLVKELKYLRSVIHEIGEGLIIRKEGEIETLIAYLQAIPTAKVRRIAKDWLRQARELDVKPAKGRLKDLRRLDRLLSALLDAVIECSDGDSTAPPQLGKTSRKKPMQSPPPRETP
jgi:hypothetical protein